MDRRGFLRGTGTATIGIIAGCAESDDTQESDSVQDKDGDGVPDEHDYAPRDPDVQSRSDVVTETRTPTSTPTPVIDTPTETAIPTQQTDTSSAPSSQTNTIRADNGALKEYANHPIEYSADHATVRLYSDLIDNTYPNGAEVIAFVEEYPGSTRNPELLSFHRSASFSPPRNGETTITVRFDDRVSATNPVYYWFALVPADKEFSAVDADEVDFLCETDRLRERSGSLSRSRHPSEPGVNRRVDIVVNLRRGVTYSNSLEPPIHGTGVQTSRSTNTGISRISTVRDTTIGVATSMKHWTADWQTNSAVS